MRSDDFRLSVPIPAASRTHPCLYVLLFSKIFWRFSPRSIRRRSTGKRRVMAIIRQFKSSVQMVAAGTQRVQQRGQKVHRYEPASKLAIGLKVTDTKRSRSDPREPGLSYATVRQTFFGRWACIPPSLRVQRHLPSSWISRPSRAISGVHHATITLSSIFCINWCTASLAS
jgi:hypothetical protein